MWSFLFACTGAPEPPAAPEPAQPLDTESPMVVLAHGGVGSPPERSDGCRRAVEAAFAALDAGADPLDAAVAGVVVMEDDPRFNAGTGSRVRIDGESVQMDASVMTSDGRFGAVAVIEHVQNPVKVARAVVDSPHLALAGDGATRFARTLGLPVYDPATDDMRAATQEIVQRLRAADPELPASWQGFDWRGHWNFERTLAEVGLSEEDLGSDTVGVVVRGEDGLFAAALSTGGTAITLRGRVGDVPIHGAGLYAGKHGAVAATGTGERIVEAALSRSVHRWMSEGMTPQEAADRAVTELDPVGAIGLIVVNGSEIGVAADRDMAWAGRIDGEPEWLGPQVGSPAGVAR